MGIENLKDKQILLDACVLLCGLENRPNPAYSFSNMRIYFMDKSFNYFSNLLVHDAIIHELNKPGRTDVHSYIMNNQGQRLRVVGEDGLFGVDPHYTSIFTEIAQHYKFQYDRHSDDLFRCPCKDRGEIASLAYAAHHEIPYFITKDEGVFIVQEDLTILKNIKIYGLEIFLAIGCMNNKDADIRRALKSLYKSACYSSIRRGRIPQTLGEYLDSKQWEAIC